MAEEMNLSKDEQIGIHKGSLSVLAKEREEFMKLLNVVEQLMQAHIKALKDLGVDLEAEAKKAQEAMKGAQAEAGDKKEGEDLAERLA